MITMASSPTFHDRDGSLNSAEDDSASLSSSSDSYSPNSYQPRRRRQRTTSSNRSATNGGVVSNGSAQSQGRKGAQDKSQPKLCVICGDKAKGVNFNALTCMSCKAFFRRNALRNKEMKCPFQDRCSVDKITRKFCSKCRLKKCFDCGMKKEWILSEEEKLAIKEKIARNRARRQTESAAELSTSSARKRGRKNTVSLDYSDALEFRLLDTSQQQTQVVSVQQLSQSQTQQASTGVSGCLDVFSLTTIPNQQASTQQTSNSNSNGNDIFCMESFDSMGVDSNGSSADPVFEWPTGGAVVDPTVGVDSLANDLNDCCQMLFANDLLFDSEDSVKQEFLDMEHSNMNSNDFSQYLLHGTDPNIQNGRCVPLLSCAQQFQQSENGVGGQSLARFQYSKFDDIEAELPDFLSACLGSSNVLNSHTTTHDPAVHVGNSGAYYQNCQQEVPLPNDLAFLSGGLIQPEKELIAELTEACKPLVSPYRRIVEHDQHESLLSCRVTEHSLMRLVKMSKKISHFAKLNICDRVKLLKAGLIEMLSIRSVLMYLPEREAWSMVNDDFKINVIVKMNVIRPFCTRANWQRHRDFPGLFRLEWQRDPTIFDLLTTLVLFTPRANLTEPSRVLDEHMRYSYLLRRYLETKYSGDSEHAKEVYDRLMDTIKEMRELNGDIVNFFRGYHKLMGASPLFTQILELPPSAECIERSNEILSALSDESNNFDFSQQTSHSIGASSNASIGNNNTTNSANNANIIGSGSNGGTLMTPNILGSIPSGNSIFVQENMADNSSASAPNNNACFGILNSVN